MSNVSQTPAPTATNEIPARERFALRTVEARIGWWVEQARRPTVEREKVAA